MSKRITIENRDQILSSKLLDEMAESNLFPSTKPFKTGSPSRASYEERILTISSPHIGFLARKNSVNESESSLKNAYELSKDKSQKEMTKAERRALQEQQRAAKAEKNLQNKNQNRPPIDKGSNNNKPPSEVKSLNTSTSGSHLETQIKTISKVKSSKQMRVSDISMIRSGSLFLHLSQFETNKMAALDSKVQSGQIHPVVHHLGIQYSTFKIYGGTARCLAMLEGFQKVIADYNTPPGLSIQRHLTTYIGKQIDYINTTRPLAATMKTAIRYLKNEIATLSMDLPDEDAKAHLCKRIQHFIRERIVYPAKSIAEKTIEKIQNGDVILTFGASSLVIDVLTCAQSKGIVFSVIVWIHLLSNKVIDSRPKCQGQETIRTLSQLKIPCTYMMMNALSVGIKNTTKVIVGASSVLSNGSVMSRLGTAAIAMMAKETRVPVIVCAETYKFSDNVRLDSFVWNEIGDPKEVIDLSKHKIANILDKWESIPTLNVLNLYYDITPAKFITVLVCESGFIPSTSVPTILREMGDCN